MGAKEKIAERRRRAVEARRRAAREAEQDSSKWSFRIVGGAAIDGSLPSSDLVTVSLPYFQAPNIHRTVESLLDSLHDHLIVVILGDGDPVPLSELGELADDPRLVVVNLPTNRGRYFCHDAVLRASPGPFFAVQNANDITIRGRFTHLTESIISLRSDAAFGNTIDHAPDGSSRVLFPTQKTMSYGHWVDQFGLFRKSSLLALGGYYGGFRLGYDTLITNLLRVLGRNSVIEKNVYVRYPHDVGDTEVNARIRSIEQAHDLFASIMRSQTRSDAIEQARKRIEARADASKDVTADVVTQIRKEIDDRGLASLHASLNAALNASPKPIWGINRTQATMLYQRALKREAKNILDVGVGMSTLALAVYAKQRAATMTAIEHDRRLFGETSTALSRVGLGDIVDLRHTPIKDSFNGRWYGTRLPETKNLDFVIVNGPRHHGDARLTMSIIGPKLAPGGEIWVPHFDRLLVQSAIRDWQSRWPIDGEPVEVGGGVMWRGQRRAVSPTS